jgi:hypothetical protein
LTKYTHGYDSDINKTLRGDFDYKDTYNDSKKIQSLIMDIDEIFENSPSLSETITLYRGMNRDSLSTQTYQSTSIDKDVALSFIGDADCCLYIISVSPGCKILPLFNISKHPGEKEILLDRDCIFVVTKRSEVNGIGYIYVTMLPPESNILENTPPILKFEEEEKPIEADKLLKVIQTAKDVIDDFYPDDEDKTEDNIYFEIKDIYERVFNKKLSDNDRGMLLKLYYGV